VKRCLVSIAFFVAALAAADPVLDRVPARHSVGSPDGALTALCVQTRQPSSHRENVGLVQVRDACGRILARTTFGERIVVRAQWSPDSQYCVFTTANAQGHSPWHQHSYVFCRSDRTFRYMDEVVGSVIEHDFTFESPASAVMTIHDFSSGLSAPTAPKKVHVDLRRAARRMHRHHPPPGFQWPRTI
jgi:hypothetical protein